MGLNIQIAYRQPKNLKQLVGGSKMGVRRETEILMWCVQSARKIDMPAKFCWRGKHSRAQIDCQSSFLIYLATCQKCHGQYVGKSTQPFTRRHSGHKQEIKNRIGGLGQHYGGKNGCGYENLRVTIIEQVEIGNHGVLGKREIFWQNQLRCFVENGGQAHCKRKEK